MTDKSEKIALIDNKILSMREKIKQEMARKQKIMAAMRHNESKKARSDDARRKILIGAFVLEQLQKNGISPSMFTCEGKTFSEWLLRDGDRALFNLKTEKIVPEEKKEQVAHEQKKPLQKPLNEKLKRKIDLSSLDDDSAFPLKENKHE